MGGSSLAPDVIREVLGVAPGWPRFHCSIRPIRRPFAQRRLPPRHRSTYLDQIGTTIEPNSLAAHFRPDARGRGVCRSGAGHFVAITDEGTCARAPARATSSFATSSSIRRTSAAATRRCVVSSASSPRAQGAERARDDRLGTRDAGGCRTGRRAGATANHSRCPGLAMWRVRACRPQQLTLVVPRRSNRSASGSSNWSPRAPEERYGHRSDSGASRSLDRRRRAAIDCSCGLRLHGVVRRRSARRRRECDQGLERAGRGDRVDRACALAGEFVRWEVATAVPARSSRSPVDEPNVQQAKDATKVLLDRFKSTKQSPIPAPDRTLDSGIALTLSEAARGPIIGAAPPRRSLRCFARGYYFALLAYLGPDK